MKVITPDGRVEFDCQAITAAYSLNGAVPTVRDDDDGLMRFLHARKVAGVSGIYLQEASPKVQDDDDGLWRWLRTRTVGGIPSLYLADPGESRPGNEAVVQDDDGALFVVKSRTIGGYPTIYLKEI